MHRFFAPAIDPGDESVALPREEAEHLTRVLRLGAGEAVTVFDGRGHEYLARVASAVRRDVRVTLLRRVEPAAEPAVHVTLAQAVLRADRMDEVVRDAVMLGVAAVQPLVTTRTETTVAALSRSGRVDRWQRVALSSVKQSRRAVLPAILQPLALEAFLGEAAPDLRLMFVEPAAGAPVTPLAPLQTAPRPAAATVLVGPEGGWTDAEWRAAASAGVRLVTLGARTLRADAVAVAALSVLAFIWDD